MSYVIVYDKQVIKTPTGYSFVILHGDNNVWEDNKRRARDWNCWVLNKPIEEINKYFSSWHKGYEHFKFNGKFVDDAGLDKWVKNGIKNAKTIEEIKILKSHMSIECCLGIWKDSNYHTELNTFVHTTEEYLNWVKQANERQNKKAADESIFISVSFGEKEPLRLGKIVEGPVVLKCGNRYVIEVNEETKTWKTCSYDPSEAVIFNSFNDAIPYLNRNYIKHNLHAVSAKNLNKNVNKDYVIQILNINGNKVGYYMSGNKAGIRHAFYLDCAKRFTLSQAKSVLKRLNNRHFSRQLSFEIVSCQSA